MGGLERSTPKSIVRHSTAGRARDRSGHERAVVEQRLWIGWSFRQAKEEAPAAVRDLFERYSENGAMGVEQLKRFLVEVQSEEEGETTKVEALAIIDSILRDSKHQIRFPKKGGGGGGSLGLDGFFRYLFGEANPPISPSLGVHHDMTAPLSHYFIYTSHNIYLTGNQLNSDCSDVPIIEALKRGV
ncbi:Phosphoinositide phospholipase C 2 [Acorus calamus]|uniref:Phosphoinositide phospholipase C n=1 Tax=Acorus calamus TaxID=4465 RepID=A0AAV9C3P7_ACOCL|nr:Phosphoinositide phospholipase C 2 [Acorus calamus]